MKDREARAAGVVADALPELGLSGAVWVAGDPSGRIEAAVRAQGLSLLSWKRTGPDASAWPDDRRASAAILRLPKGREALRMALHALAARVDPGGSLYVVGANDEGIRSADKSIAEVAANPRTVEARRHCRLWVATVRGDVAFRAKLDDWAETVHGALPGGEAGWTSFPGLFAHGHLDPATGFLLETLHREARPLEAGARVLDFGCGAGVIAMWLASSGDGIEVHALDPDPLALEATRRNVPGVVLHAGPGLGAVAPASCFDRIVSNPPIHTGRDQHHDTVAGLCREAPHRLRHEGELWIVAQRTVPVGRMLGGGFRRVAEAAATRSFRVWRAGSPSVSVEHR